MDTLLPGLPKTTFPNHANDFWYGGWESGKCAAMTHVPAKLLQEVFAKPFMYPTIVFA